MPRPYTKLSARHLDIMRLVARGYSNQEIASELNCSYQTVKNHLTVIMERTGATSRTGVLWRLGWTQVPNETYLTPRTIERTVLVARHPREVTT